MQGVYRGLKQFRLLDPTGDNILSFSEPYVFGGAILYHTMNGKCYLHNESPVAITIAMDWFSDNWTRLTPGRPNVDLQYNDAVEILKYEVNKRWDPRDSRQGKGITIRLGALLQPEGILEFHIDGGPVDGHTSGVDFAWTSDPSAIDDGNGAGRPPREPPEAGIVAVPTGASNVVLTWGGQYTRLGFSEHQQQLPDGIQYSESSTAQGSRGFLSNLSTQPWCVYLSFFIGGYTGSFYSVGTNDGTSINNGSYTRTGIWFSLAPGEMMAYEPQSIQGFDVYGLAVFVPRVFADRFNDQVN